MLKLYLKKIYEENERGDAREESFYSVLSDILKEYSISTGKKNIHITTLPKKTEAGNPDFRIWDGKQHIIGYIEAKAPTIENLEQVEVSEQLKRYRNIFPNLILTNFFEFRLYRNGTLVDKVLIGRPFILHKLRTVPHVEKETNFLKLLEEFFSFSLPKVYDAKTLAIELAKRTRFLKDEIIAEELKTVGESFLTEHNEKQTRMSVLHGFYEAFRKYLIKGLNKDDFADLYSQTITYGLFAARSRSENSFNRKLAYDNIPHTIGILKDIFQFISLGDLPRQMEWGIDDISEVLAVTDVKKILQQYFHEGKGKDPVVHFYETFLAEYDPKTREKRGVYYTPEPVVSYIVRSLHSILKEHFNKVDGFASDSVTVLDPAAGTLTFLANAAKLAVDEFISKYGEGGRKIFIKEHILKNFYAFELMMAPYAVGHLKMSFLLEELGYRLHEDDRFKLYLTNTLEMEELAQTELPGMYSLSEESHLAGKVKKDQPILVIIGNPPYSGNSANASEKYITVTSNNGKERRKKVKTWIGNLIEDYKYVDSKPLGERNPKWLQDDYVKFIRFAQWKINRSGGGVVGFITNHSYLNNPTFRGMRQSLMKTFDEIYILNLHGNSLKKEKCPGGSKDENVFDIRQGVAIAFFIKRQEVKNEPFHSFRTSPQIKLFVVKEPEEKPKEHSCNVYYSDLWGHRKYKCENWLLNNDIKTTKWKKLLPKSEFYLFTPRNEQFLKRYEEYPKITEIFPVNSVGIVTSRDKFVIDTDKSALERRIRMLLDKKIPDEIIRDAFSLKDKPNWKLKYAREKLMDSENWKGSIKRILYRPFDLRWIYYHNSVIERSRYEVMSHMIEKNLGLLTNRQIRTEKIRHSWVTNTLADLHIMETANASAYIFPLYIYKQKYSKKRSNLSNVIMIFEPKEKYETKKPNIAPKFLEKFMEIYKSKLKPEEIFYYIYGVLYSNIYRNKYTDLLRLDFPRIPFTKDHKLFTKIAKYGKRLVDLHLLKSVELEPPVAKFQGEGDGRVEKLRYDEQEQRVYVNKNQYFEGLSKKVWEYQIGGYQVCYKWLKDRKRIILSLDDMKHYCNIVTSLEKTIGIQKVIDNIYPEIEKTILFQ